MKYLVQPEGLGKPLGKYSHVAIDDRSGLVSVAGQVGLTESGDLAGDGSLAAQVSQALKNLRAALEAGGSSFNDVLKFTTYLTDADLIEEFMIARTELFSEAYPDAVYPPNTLLVIDRLVEARFLVEIEALAVQSQTS